MAYKSPDFLIEEFKLDWEAALCPSVEDFINRCHPERRDTLYEGIAAYLEYAPTPPYSPVQQRRQLERARRHIDSERFQKLVSDSAAVWKSEFDSLPFYVKVWRKAEWKLCRKPIWWLKVQRTKIGKQPWE